MTTSRWWGGWAVGLLLLGLAPPSRAEDQAEVIRRASALLGEIAADPDSGIPPGKLREARGILIIPRMVETQVGLGRKKGRGVYLMRAPGGTWGEPRAIALNEAKAGPEAGRMVSEVVVLYMTQKSADEYWSRPGSVAFGLEWRVNSHLRGSHRFSGPKLTDGPTPDGTLAYTRSKGLIVGISALTALRTADEPRDRPRSALTDPTLRPSPTVPNAEGQLVGTPPPAPTPAGEPRSESPEASQLHAVLAAMTRPSPSSSEPAAPADPQLRYTAWGPMPGLPPLPPR